MPWGDPSMLSSNFLQHLNLRHRFEYDTFVDYEQDDDEMLRRAIEASLTIEDDADSAADATWDNHDRRRYFIPLKSLYQRRILLRLISQRVRQLTITKA